MAFCPENNQISNLLTTYLSINRMTDVSFGGRDEVYFFFGNIFFPIKIVLL